MAPSYAFFFFAGRGQALGFSPLWISCMNAFGSLFAQGTGFIVIWQQCFSANSSLFRVCASLKTQVVSLFNATNWPIVLAKSTTTWRQMPIRSVPFSSTLFTWQIYIYIYEEEETGLDGYRTGSNLYIPSWPYSGFSSWFRTSRRMTYSSVVLDDVFTVYQSIQTLCDSMFG